MTAEFVKEMQRAALARAQAAEVENARLREALDAVLRWPLPRGTVETWALPAWLAKKARAVLTGD